MGHDHRLDHGGDDDGGFATRSLGIGYAGGSALLFTAVLAALAAWHRTLGSISVDTVREPRAERFYWITITLSQPLDTALGDWTADSGGLGYGGAALVFGALLLVPAALYYRSSVSRVTLFWSAFILTRPLASAAGGGDRRADPDPAATRGRASGIRGYASIASRNANASAFSVSAS